MYQMHNMSCYLLICMKNHKNKHSSFLKYWDVSNLYGSARSQKLPVNDFNWVKHLNLLKIS